MVPDLVQMFIWLLFAFFSNIHSGMCQIANILHCAVQSPQSSLAFAAVPAGCTTANLKHKRTILGLSVNMNIFLAAFNVFLPFWSRTNGKV